MIKTSGATLTIALSRELKIKINLLISSGRYSSASEVLRTALRKQLEEEHFGQLVEDAHREFVEGSLVKIDINTDLSELLGRL